MQNDVVNDAVLTAPGAYMQVVGIVQSLAVGMLLQNAKLFQLLAAGNVDFSSYAFWIALLQATAVFQLIVLTWHVSIQNVTAFRRAYGIWDSYIPFSTVFAEYFLILNSSPERFQQWELCMILFMAAAILAYTHGFAVSRREAAKNDAAFALIGRFPFWIRVYLIGIGLVAAVGFLMDAGQPASRAIIAGIVDGGILLFSILNTRFFWAPLIKAQDLRRG